jgi:hypothetical protein
MARPVFLKCLDMARSTGTTPLLPPDHTVPGHPLAWTNKNDWRGWLSFG